MAALAADTPIQHRGADLGIRHPLSAVTDVFYEGALLWWSTSGDGVTPVIAAGTEFAGVCLEGVSATAATTRVKLATKGSFLFGMTIASAQVFNGQVVFGDVSAGSDNPTDCLLDSPATANDIPVGVGEEYVSATSGWVNIERRNFPTLAT